MTKKELNLKQARWTQILTTYNFKIVHCSNYKNSANDFSRRFGYKRISSLKVTLLLTLQNKLTFLSSEEFLTQSERKNSIILILILQLIEMLIKFDAELAKLTRNRRNIIIKLTSIFKLIDIQIIISKKSLMTFLTIFMKGWKFIKFLITSDKRSMKENFLY